MRREGCEEVGAEADLGDSSSSGHRENSTQREAESQRWAERLASGAGALFWEQRTPMGP